MSAQPRASRSPARSRIDTELADLQAFVSVVEAAGFTEAARRQGTTKSVLSRRVSGLEQLLGATLLERGARGIRVTEVGAVYYAKCVRILESIEAANDFVASFHNVMRGRLRVAIGDDALARQLTGCFREFSSAYPDVVLELLVAGSGGPDDPDPDLDIRMLRDGDDALVCVVLKQCREVLCASPLYLAARGVPASPDLLDRYDGLLHTWDGRHGWELHTDVGNAFYRVRERLRSESATQLIVAAESGMGLVLQPDYLVADAIAAGRLERVLPTCSGPLRTLAALYTPSRRSSRKTRALLDFLRAHFAASSER